MIHHYDWPGPLALLAGGRRRAYDLAQPERTTDWGVFCFNGGCEKVNWLVLLQLSLSRQLMSHTVA